MKEALGPQRVISLVTLVDVLPGDRWHDPTIITSRLIKLKGGGSKLVTEKVPVLDPALFHQLSTEVTKGNDLQITVETDWSHPDLPASVVAFSTAGVGLASTAAR